MMSKTVQKDSSADTAEDGGAGISADSSDFSSKPLMAAGSSGVRGVDGGEKESPCL